MGTAGQDQPGQLAFGPDGNLWFANTACTACGSARGQACAVHPAMRAEYLAISRAQIEDCVMVLKAFRSLTDDPLVKILYGIIASALLCACSATGGSTPPVDSSNTMPAMPQTAVADPSFGAAASSTSSAQPTPASSESPAPVASPTAQPDANWSDYPVGKPWKGDSTHGSWYVHSNGSGNVTVVANDTIANALRIAPKASKSRGEMHDALVTTTANFDDFDATLDLQTVKQLRTGSAPGPREAGWLLWHYTDDRHFYYFAPRTDGWELGKADPEYPGGHRILAGGTSPAFPIGTMQKIRVVQNGDAITVYDNKLKIVSFTDKESPYASGRFGLYAKDAEALFGSLHLTTSAGEQTI